MNQYRSQMALDLNTQSSIVYFANGRDHKEANGHVLGPLLITPKIPIPHAYRWFYNKFSFAKNTEELIGGPHMGLRRPEPDLSCDSTTRILSEMSSHPAKETQQNVTSSKLDTTLNLSENTQDDTMQKDEDAVQNNIPSSRPTPLNTTPKK